jgi:hypothetical protein
MPGDALSFWLEVPSLTYAEVLPEDSAYDPATQRLELIPAKGAFVAYHHRWTNSVRSSS